MRRMQNRTMEMPNYADSRKPAFRKILRNKGRIEDKITKHMFKPKHKLYQSIYKSDYIQKPHSTVLPSWYDLDFMEKAKNKRRQKLARNRSFNYGTLYDRKKEFQYPHSTPLSNFLSDIGRLTKGPRRLTHRASQNPFNITEKPTNAKFTVLFPLH